jgi:hypothetical protein
MCLFDFGLPIAGDALMHWSIADDNEPSAAAAEPAARSRSHPELLEQLHGREPGLVGELLAELA